ncbi:SagB-type dehydrogenase domain protein [Thermoanaerobacter mathranii subsp. mathranii str. A3]|uniref:SagB-type dehydrogenase domain protein n=1 Tax=Thermoanaerobacter mathranii subsp. mathranii (strain DSM 11426 / CCUG 53645 / CIP 108742 / A3) TaxID=583358 RepID=A0ABM5LNA5_THEM3|nr:SagB family peptide dehydrogenase [Thermoanaerobacter mathranii]ADH60239.1 SagB-type dehydrogenase domain protein [Thermoanaerobacter mathranii subsp. mathranii str. A3]
MDGVRLKYYNKKIQQLKELLANCSDLEQVSILHEIIDDTPYKTKNYMKYMHKGYYIKHNKEELIDNSLKQIKLQVNDFPSKNIVEIIKNRYSVRDYENREVSFEAFSQIIHYSFGVKHVAEGVYDRKSYLFKYTNSQGGLNYLDLYIIVNNVEGVEQGLYYYDFIGNKICQIDNGNMRGIIKEIHFQNEFTAYSSFLCIVVADLRRVVPKYYKRAYRFAHVDAGILLAYLQLLAENNGISSCIVAGFLEHKIETLLNLSKDEYPIATIGFGYKSRSFDVV